MRRPGPRPLSAALADYTREARPATLLAQIQGIWAGVVGPVVADEAWPVAERAGTLTVACRSATWANELELLAPELLERLRKALGCASGRGLEALRFKVGSPDPPPR